MKLIDKDVLVAEIEKLDKCCDTFYGVALSNNAEHAKSVILGKKEQLRHIKNYINTLEVKEVGLDYIKEELDRLVRIHKPYGDFGWGTLYNVATHFFELGLRAQKMQDEIKIGETEIYLEDDGGEPPYDGIQWLDLSCMEYEIPKDKFKDGDNVEIIIRKTQKGE